MISRKILENYPARWRIRPGNGWTWLILGRTKQSLDHYRGTKESVDQYTGSLVAGRVVFGSDLPDGLKQNQRVSTRIVLSSKKGVLKARRGPFLEAGGGRKIYRVEGDLATQQAITVGATSITEVEIVSGLEEGDTIVISDTSRFQDAKSVLIRN
jgi:HlyD family secretion protein